MHDLSLWDVTSQPALGIKAWPSPSHVPEGQFDTEVKWLVGHPAHPKPGFAPSLYLGKTFHLIKGSLDLRPVKSPNLMLPKLNVHINHVGNLIKKQILI